MRCAVAPREANEAANRQNTRADLRAAPNATVIIQVSRMESLKGQLVLLEALSKLKDLSDLVCWFVGGAQRASEIAYLQELKRLANELGIAQRVHFLGERRDVPRLLAAADIFCQPNTGPDAFGISFVEALCWSTSLTTSIGGSTEIVDELRRLVAAHAAGLATALRRLIRIGLRSELGGADPRALSFATRGATQAFPALKTVAR